MKNVNRGGPAVLGRMREPREVSIDEVIGRLDDPTLVVLDTRADRAAFMKRTSSSIAKVVIERPLPPRISNATDGGPST